MKCMNCHAEDATIVYLGDRGVINGSSCEACHERLLGIRPTGLKRRSEATRRRFSAERPYPTTGLLAPATVLQPAPFLHDQGNRPSCEGQSHASGVEQVVGWRVSALDLWTDARRRQGSLSKPDDGTESEFVIESLLCRGVSPYVPDEDSRPVSEDTVIPTLEQELAADQRRVDVAAIHRQILLNRTESAVDALLRGQSVTMGTGVYSGYFSVGVNEIVDTDRLGENGDQGGHSQRVRGYIAPGDTSFPATWRGCFVLINSWSGWGGIRLPCVVTMTNGQVLATGSELGQCCLIRPAVLETAWEVDAVEIRFA